MYLPKKISINITESEKELQLLLNKTNTDRVRGRLKALLLLKKGKACYQNELARKVGFTEKTVREWLKLYQREGLSSLLEIRVGGNRRSLLSSEAILYLENLLKDPQTTITSYVELHQLICKEFNTAITYQGFYSFCTRVFKSKLKVSRKSHYKKDPQAVEAFKKTP